MMTDSRPQQHAQAAPQSHCPPRVTRIGFEAKDAVAMLAGHADGQSAIWSAERAAQPGHGLTAMAAEFKAQLTSPSRRTDADVLTSVENVLEWISSLPAGTIKVMVERGWVTLYGDVDWQYQRQGALDSVRSLVCVAGVSDQIGVKPAVAASAVKSYIEAALERTSIADTKKVSVAVHGSHVTLSGTVANWYERQLASNSAWGTPGVRNVVDMLTLAR